MTARTTRPDVRELRSAVFNGSLYLTAANPAGIDLLLSMFNKAQWVRDEDGTDWLRTGVEVCELTEAPR